jgi:Tol biopolymer transport system component
LLLLTTAAQTPTPKIEFTTTEGTWLSLDLSPEGRTILFDLLGDLYTLPIAGGEAKPLMTGLAFDSQPRYSPDGRHIAFVSDRDGADNLWIAEADGSNARRLTTERQARVISPVWTPDGQAVVASLVSPVTTRGTAELWSFPVSGGEGKRLNTAPAGAASPYVSAPWPGAYGAHITGNGLAPDGKTVYYAAVTPRPYRSINGALAQIIRHDLATSNEDVLIARAGNAFKPVVSPDGRWLVYGSRFESQTGLRVRELATGEERWLIRQVSRDELESRASRDILPNYVFTPDGQDLLIAYGGKIHRLRLADGHDTIIPFSAKVSLEVGAKLDFPIKLEQAAVRARIAQQPVLSPDGRRLAFTAFAELYVMDLPGGTPRRLTNARPAREFHPAWSPDGEWLAFVTWTSSEANEGGHIWKVRADGASAPQRLSRLPAFYRDPVWNPDGQRLVALRAPRQARLESDATAELEIISLPASGGDATVITTARGLTRPHFAPDAAHDPTRLYFSSPQGLVSLKRDGSDRRTHFRVAGKAPIDEIQISPDGSKALALSVNQLYLFDALPASSNTPVINLAKATKLTTVGADTFAWAKGNRITWAVGATFYRLALADKSAEAIALNIEKPRPTPGGSIVLRGARAITMVGNEVIPDADIVITRNRIAAIGKRGTVKPPPNSRILDVRGKTIIPGLIDLHAHWDISRSVLDVEGYNFPANLAYGVTSGRDPQSFSNDVFAYRDLEEAGEQSGPRIFSTGQGVFTTTDFQSYEEARDTLRRYQQHYRTNQIKSYQVGNRQQRQWVVQACRELQLMPTTEGGGEMKLDLTHAIDGFSGNEHSLPVGAIYDDVVQLFARTGITYTPTLLVAFGGPFALYSFIASEHAYLDAKLRRFTPQSVLYDRLTQRMMWFREEEYTFPVIAAGASKIAQAGGHIGVGSHGELQGMGLHWEMWALAGKGANGMRNHDVLRAATLNGAEAIGLGQELGSLVVGKLADLIVLDRDPLVNIRHTNTIRYVMKNGELYEGDTLKPIWPQALAAPVFWWQRELPVNTR